MSLKRTFKAMGLAIALFATSQAVTAQPPFYAWCCSEGCNLVLWSNCPVGQGYLTEEACHTGCV